MPRWEGDARGRLERAALALFAERGYERTAVSQIAERAGLTERSFYRHFPDKREVLFAGGEDLESHLTAAVREAAPGTAPLDALVAAAAGASTTFRPRAFVRERAEVIHANPALRERELVKLSGLSQALTAALVDGGAAADVAALAVGVVMTIMQMAVHRWSEDERADYAAVVATVADELVDVVGSSRLGRSGTTGVTPRS